MCRFIELLGSALGLLFALNSIASEALPLFRQMVESDSIGDPGARILLAAPKAVVVVPDARQADHKRIPFELDADALEVATNWSVEEVPGHCGLTKCDVVVKYLVVATTEGRGVPSWQNREGREIRLLDEPVTKAEQYRLQKIQGRWVISRFYPPYVSPLSLEDFFLKELQAVNVTDLSRAGDPRAEENKAIVQAWRLRQLELLRLLNRR